MDTVTRSSAIYTCGANCDLHPSRSLTPSASTPNETDIGIRHHPCTAGLGFDQTSGAFDNVFPGPRCPTGSCSLPRLGHCFWYNLLPKPRPPSLDRQLLCRPLLAPSPTLPQPLQQVDSAPDCSLGLHRSIDNFSVVLCSHLLRRYPNLYNSWIALQIAASVFLLHRGKAIAISSLATLSRVSSLDHVQCSGSDLDARIPCSVVPVKSESVNLELLLLKATMVFWRISKRGYVMYAAAIREPSSDVMD